MALEIKLSLDSINEDAAFVILKDTTGVYSAENLTGYGAPNDELASLNRVLLADKILSGRKTALTPLADFDWKLATDADCLYDLLFVAAKAPVVAQSYAVDMVVFYNGTLYKSLLLQNYSAASDLADTAKWKPIVLVTDYPLLAVTGAYHVHLPYVHTSHTEIAKGNLAIEMSQAGTEGLDFEQLSRNFLWGEVNYLAAKYSAAWGGYVEAGEAIEEAALAFSTDNYSC